MDIALWIVQVLLAAGFLIAGVTKALQYERAKVQMTWVNDVPRGLVAFRCTHRVGFGRRGQDRNAPGGTPRVGGTAQASGG